MIQIKAPATISRAVVLDFIRSLGIDPNDARELRIGMQRVELDVMARNEAGHPFFDPHGELAVHTIALDIRGDDD